MANFQYSVIWRDADGHTSKQGGYLVAADLAAATTALETIVEASDILSGAVIDNVLLTADVDYSGWTLKTDPNANSDVEIGGRFQFASAAGYKANITVPGFKKDDYSVSGGGIDLADLDVIAFIASITAGGGATSHYEDITAFVKGYEVFNGQR